MAYGIGEVHDLIHIYGFGEYTAELTALLEPSVLIRTTRTEAEGIAQGASRFGGVPDLPPELEWPEFRGRPLTLVAQLKLGDFTPFNLGDRLPHTGWLCFFLDPERDSTAASEADHRVIYVHESADGLCCRPPSDQASTFPVCRTDFALQYTLPDRSSQAAAPFVAASDAWDRYGDLLLELRQQGLRGFPAQPATSFAKRLLRGKTRFGFHQLLGHPERENLDPDTISGLVLGHGHPTCSSSEAITGQDWTLLLEVRSDDHGLGVTWGQDGRLLFVIRRQDLRQRAFHAIQLRTTYA